MKVLVTGANGFVGRALFAHLNANGHSVVPLVRSATGLPGEVRVAGLENPEAYINALQGCDSVVHLAARVHVMTDDCADPVAVYRAMNVTPTLSLAGAAAAVGVKRFVFMSTVKVHGEGSATPYSVSDTPAPEDAYAKSKWEAEQGLREIAAQTGLELVVLRPPLIYGPGVKANFRKLMDTLVRGLPLPLGAVHNQRSMLYLGNLVDAITVCLSHPAAAGKTYVLSDAEDVSTPLLIRKLAQALNTTPRLWPVPLTLLRVAGLLGGKRKQVDRLLGSLSVDQAMICADLGWVPPYSMQQGLQKTVDWYLANKDL